MEKGSLHFKKYLLTHGDRVAALYKRKKETFNTPKKNKKKPKPEAARQVWRLGACWLQRGGFWGRDSKPHRGQGARNFRTVAGGGGRGGGARWRSPAFCLQRDVLRPFCLRGCRPCRQVCPTPASLHCILQGLLVAKANHCRCFLVLDAVVSRVGVYDEISC